MVSTEGACAAYFNYGQIEVAAARAARKNSKDERHG